MRRPLTDAEKAEARRFGYLGRSGRLSELEFLRAQELYAIDPEGYAAAQRVGRAEADEQVNPLAGRYVK